MKKIGHNKKKTHRIKNIALYFLRFIVGGETGFTDEGNTQWYYTLALAISLMLIWQSNPQIGLVFTILAIIQYATVFVYGLFNISDNCSIKLSYLYVGIHLIILMVAFIVNSECAFISVLVTMTLIYLAPDVFGENALTGHKHDFYNGNHIPLVFHTIILAAFVEVVLLLPIMLWIKIVIIIGTLILHPIIDIFEAEGIDIAGVTGEILDKIREHEYNEFFKK